MRGINRLKLMGVGVAAASLFVAPSAHAAIAGATPSSFGDRPNLSSVTVTEDHNLGVKSADFCFDRNVQLTAQAAQTGRLAQSFFHLVGYDSAVSSDNTNNTPFGPAFVEPLARNCVRAYFNIATDVVTHTIGTVDQGAVRDDAGGLNNKVNLGDAAPLSNSQQGTGLGDTVGPDVVSVVADTGANTLRITYDRVVGVIGNAALFHYYDQAGNVVNGDSAINAGTPDAKTIIVHFPSGPNKSVRDAVRFAAEDGAIQDASGQNSPIDSDGVTFGGPSGTTTTGETARPDLVGARISGPTSVDYTFDEPVKVADTSNFIVYNPNQNSAGTPAVAIIATPLNSDSHTVRAFFRPPGQASDQFRNGLVLAAVLPNAVHANDSAALRNSIGSLAIGQLPNGSGFTSAPDVTGLTFNKDDGTATLTLDQELGATPKPGNFHLLDCTGNDLGTANQAVVQGQDDSTTVVLIFGEDRVQNACAVGLDAGVLVGQAGDLSVEQIVGRNAVAPITTPSTPGSGTPQSPATPASTVTATGKPAVGAVSPATISKSKSSLRVASAKLKKAKSRHAVRVLRVRVNGKSKTARIRIQVIRKSHGKSKVVRTLVRTVRTNRTVSVRVGHLKKGQTIRVRLA